MSLKKSFNGGILRHAFSCTFRENILILISGILIFSVLIPVSTAALPETSIFNLDYTHNQLKFRFFSSSFSAALHGALILFGIVLAIKTFGFMFSKVKTTALFSLGITRKKTYFLRYAAGLCTILIAVILPMTISLFLNIAALGFSTRMLAFFFYSCAGLALVSIISFTVTSAACCLAGTAGESFFLAVSILGFPIVFFYGYNTIMKYMLRGNPYGMLEYNSSIPVNESLIWHFSYINPLLFFYRLSSRYYAFYEGVNSASPESVSVNALLILIFWCGAAAILAILSAFLFYRRKAENAGIFGLSKSVIYLCTISAGLAVFSGITDLVARINPQVSIVCAAIGTTLCFAAAYAVFRPKRLFRFLSVSIAELCVLLCAVFIMESGGISYSNYVPAAASVQSAEVSYIGSPDYLGESAKGSSAGKSYYIKTSYTYTSESDLENVLSAHRAFTGSSILRTGLDSTDFSKTVVPYDITFRYTLKNGKTITRYYNTAAVSELKSLLLLDDTENVRSTIKQTITNTSSIYRAGGAYHLGDIYISDAWYSNPVKVRLSEPERQVLLSCIAEDVLSQSMDERYFPSSQPAGIIMFSQNGESDSKSFAYSLQNAVVYVTKDFTSTIDFLKSHNLYGIFDFSGEITSVQVQKYNPFGTINAYKSPMSLYFKAYTAPENNVFILNKDFGKAYVIEDKEKINTLIPLLKNNYFMSDGGYLISAKISSGNYVYKYLPADSAPQYIIKAVK